MSHTQSTSSTGSARKKTAGAFDVRVIIGALLGIYGVVLLLMGLFGDPETDKTGGINANLWAGVGLFAVGVVFLAWWKLRPIVVADEEDHDEIGSRPEA